MMSHSSERLPSNDAHQWSRDEAYVDGQMSWTRMSTKKSQRHQPLLVLSENRPQESYQSSSHPQLQQTPVIVTSSQGCSLKDDSSLNQRSSCALQQSEQEHSLIDVPSNNGVSLKDENCYQPQQSLPSVGTFSPLKDHEQSSLSSCQPQEGQNSVKVPPQRHPSEDVQPSTYQSFHSPKKKGLQIAPHISQNIPRHLCQNIQTQARHNHIQLRLLQRIITTPMVILLLLQIKKSSENPALKILLCQTLKRSTQMCLYQNLKCHQKMLTQLRRCPKMLV